MAIAAEDVERTRAATDLVALVSERVGLRRVGTRWVGLCPFHNEKTPSFSVNAELGRYYCFGCQASGDAISFLRETEHLDFRGAVESLASRAGVPLHYVDERDGATAHRRNKKLADALEAAVAWYHERLLSAPDAARARQYLRSRGYDGDTVRRFRLGWAPEGWDVLVRQSGIAGELLVEAGLAFRNQSGHLTDSFRGRVLFPIFDAAGHPAGAGGRILPGGTGPKYKNTQATVLYDKSKILYGLNWAKAAIVERGQVVVCEGYTDVIGLHRAGVGEAVATCGAALAEGHVKLLTGFSRRIVLAYDADSAGQGAAERFYDWERRFETSISVVSLPPGADPADLAREHPERLRQAVADAQPYLGFRLQRIFAGADLRNPEGRAKAAEAAISLIGEHPDPLVRDQYIMQVSDRSRLSPEQLRALGRRPARRGAPNGPPPHLKRPAGPQVPPPELEALRLAVHCPEKVVGRLNVALFASGLARAAYEHLASAMTLHAAIESASPEVADLLSRLSVVEPTEDPDDVVRRLLHRAASRALAELTRRARTAASRNPGASTSPLDSDSSRDDRPEGGTAAPKAAQRGGDGLSELASMTSSLQLALQALRSVEPGPAYDERVTAAERELLALLLGGPSMALGLTGEGKGEALGNW